MKTLIIGFSKHPGIFSLLIRAITKSSVSHVYLRIPVPEYNQSVIFQASGLAVNYENYDLFTSKATVIQEYEIQVTDEQYAIGEKLRVTEVGKPYSMKEIFGYLWVLFMRNLGMNVKNPWYQGNKSYVCEVIIAFLLGLDDSACMTPEDLRRWCSKRATPSYSIL